MNKRKTPQRDAIWALKGRDIKMKRAGRLKRAAKISAFGMLMAPDASGRFLVRSTSLSRCRSTQSLIMQPALRIKKAPRVNVMP